MPSVDEQKLKKEFNSYYINIAKTASGKPQMKLRNNLDYINVNDSLITKWIIEKYKNHPSIKAIPDTFPGKKQFKIEEAKVEQITKILRNINSRKATGPDKSPPKIVKMSANIIDSHLTNIINSDLNSNAFSDSAKVATFLSDFISAYRKGYSTNQVLLRLIENWKAALDTQQTFVLMKTSWSRRIYSPYSYVFRRRLQDVFIEINIFVLVIHLQDVF